MRPALSAREITVHGRRNPGILAASMRPALSAREIRDRRADVVRHHERFNEARAFCAGNRSLAVRTLSSEPSFNEARAFCAGNRHQCRRLPIASNEASMRPALSAREIVPYRIEYDMTGFASMRPALSAREIYVRFISVRANDLASMRPALSAREIIRCRPSRRASRWRLQ